MSERGMGRKLEQGRQLELVRASMVEAARERLHADNLDEVINDGAINVVALEPEDGTEARSRESFMQLLEARAA